MTDIITGMASESWHKMCGILSPIKKSQAPVCGIPWLLSFLQCSDSTHWATVTATGL